MAAAVILEFEGVDRASYEAVNAKLGIDSKTGEGDWPAAMRGHVGGTTDAGGLVVMEVWDSQEAQAEFMNTRLGAALGEVGVPAPVRVTWVDVIGQHF